MSQVCRAHDLDKSAVARPFGGCAQAWGVAGLPNPGDEALTYTGFALLIGAILQLVTAWGTERALITEYACCSQSDASAHPKKKPPSQAARFQKALAHPGHYPGAGLRRAGLGVVRCGYVLRSDDAVGRYTTVHAGVRVGFLGPRIEICTCCAGSA